MGTGFAPQGTRCGDLQCYDERMRKIWPPDQQKSLCYGFMLRNDEFCPKIGNVNEENEEKPQDPQISTGYVSSFAKIQADWELTQPRNRNATEVVSQCSWCQ